MVIRYPQDHGCLKGRVQEQRVGIITHVAIGAYGLKPMEGLQSMDGLKSVERHKARGEA